MTSPAAVNAMGVDDFSTVNAGAGAAVIAKDDGSDVGTSMPGGGVAVAVAVLSTPPASTSAWVTT